MEQPQPLRRRQGRIEQVSNYLMSLVVWSLLLVGSQFTTSAAMQLIARVLTHITVCVSFNEASFAANNDLNMVASCSKNESFLASWSVVGKKKEFKGTI